MTISKSLFACGALLAAVTLLALPAPHAHGQALPSDGIPGMPPTAPPPDPRPGHLDGVGPPRVLEEYVGLPDPTHWSKHRVTGIRYRRATTAELDANRWAPGTFLVEASRLLQRTDRGARRVTMLIPTSDNSVRRIRFKHAGSFEGPFAVEARAGTTSPSEPVEFEAGPTRVHRYQSAVRGGRSRRRVDIRGGLMVLTATDGGVAARGAVNGHEVAVVGPSSGWSIDDLSGDEGLNKDELVRVSFLAVPATVQESWGGCSTVGICDAYCGYLGGPWDFPEPGQNDHPCSEPFNPGNDGPLVSHQCGDGADNDGDGLVDWFDPNCTHAHPPGVSFHVDKFESGRDFGLFGDGALCTDLGDGWKAHMIDVAVTVSGAFKRQYSSLSEPLRWGLVSCWIFPSQQDAEDCDSAGQCAPFDNGTHVYPYAGANTNNWTYREEVVHDLNHASVLGYKRPLSNLHVIRRGNIIVDGEAACGNAAIGAGEPLSGRSISRTGGTGLCATQWKVAAHEIAHTFGADHEVVPVTPPHTFMVEGHHVSGYVPYLSDANADIVEICLADIGCPRYADLGSAP